MVDKKPTRGKIAPARKNWKNAEVAEQADALRSGRSGIYSHVGSTPTFGTEPVSNLRLETFYYFLLERRVNISEFGSARGYDCEGRNCRIR